MAKIKLTKGKVALVDEEDFEFLNRWKWGYSTSGYARRLQHTYLGLHKYGHKIIWMHRLINNTPKGFFTDHINQDKLDNRRENLRTVTKSQNGFNREKSKNNISGFKGVYWDTWSKKWRAEIRKGYNRLRLGRYSNIKDAVKARNLAEQKYHAI